MLAQYPFQYWSDIGTILTDIGLILVQCRQPILGQYWQALHPNVGPISFSILAQYWVYILVQYHVLPGVSLFVIGLVSYFVFLWLIVVVWLSVPAQSIAWKEQSPKWVECVVRFYSLTCSRFSHTGYHNSTGSKRTGAKVCSHLDVPEMRIIVLRQRLQLEPGRVLLLRTSRLTLLVSLRYSVRLERSVWHH